MGNPGKKRCVQIFKGFRQYIKTNFLLREWANLRRAAEGPILGWPIPALYETYRLPVTEYDKIIIK